MYYPQHPPSSRLNKMMLPNVFRFSVAVGVTDSAQNFKKQIQKAYFQMALDISLFLSSTILSQTNV
jgi:hypothetical protein